MHLSKEQEKETNSRGTSSLNDKLNVAAVIEYTRLFLYAVSRVYLYNKENVASGCADGCLLVGPGGREV